jgi:hypothetical protein
MNAIIRTLGGEKAEQLARALKKRVPDLRCETCGHQDFGLLEDPDADVRFKLVRSSKHFTVEQEAATLVCTNCGRVLQFADSVFGLGAQPDQFGRIVKDE